MDNQNNFVLSQDIKDKYSEMRAGYGFRRSLEGESEAVSHIILCDINLLNKISGYTCLISYFNQPVLINNQNCHPIYQESAEYINQMCRDYFSNEMLRDINFYTKLMTFMSNYVRFKNSIEDSNLSSIMFKEHQREVMMKFNAVYDYINEHLCEDLTLEMVADVAGFSKYHFSRIFKEHSGYNYYDYLSFQRIKSAETLLLNKNLTIIEVALHSGFSSLTTFNRTFKKIKGCTPTEYRKLFKYEVH